MDETKSYEALQKPLDAFRAKTKRLAIHPTEVAVLWIVCAHLVFLPWAIGGMRPWSQWISLVLSILGMIVALIPRNYTEDHTGSTRFRLIMWPKLVRFPIFWLGLALLGLVVTQALNPAWAYQTDGKSWWMTAIPHNEWLPPGVRVPFERWGPWRMLLIYSSAFLTVCSIWIGLTRRRSVQLLFLCLAINGVALALFGLVQRLLSNGKLFWVWPSPNASFFSSFVYKNHAGAYLLMTLGVTCSLAAWYYLRGLRRLEKSSPAGVFAFSATIIGVSILVSYARGATLVMLVYLLVSVAGLFFYHRRFDTSSRSWIVPIALAAIFGLFLKSGLEALDSRLAWDRLTNALTDQDKSLASRGLASAATFNMLRDTWPLGAGSGSFRFVFPVYQEKYPELFQGPSGHRWYLEHAHNDILEIPSELGLVGVILIAASFGFWLTNLVRAYFWENILTAGTLLVALLTVVYSGFDFIFSNPAVLVTWCALWPAMALWTQMEELNVRA